MTRDLFSSFLASESIFKNKEVLRHSYIPDVLPHREEQINEIASILVSALRGETPSNIFIYGKTGTGKTAVTRYVGKELHRAGKEKDKPTHFIYINCEVVDTQYRVLQNIANHFIGEWTERIPFTGWPTDEVYAKLREMMEKARGVVVIVLDEVDKLKGDEVLYNLSRLNTDLDHAKASVIGISNDLKFTEFLDPRVKSSMGEENMIFPPYNADQLKDILEQRAEMALKENTLDESVVPLCSAYAAQEHGDARRALDLFRVAAEIADRDGLKRIAERHVRRAQQKIELDRVTEVVRTLPTQSKLVLISIIVGERIQDDITPLTTGEVYSIYKELASSVSIDHLTQRRITDLVSELDMLGIVTARVISKGRYGRTRHIHMSTSIDKTIEVLDEDEMLRGLARYRPKIQTRLL
jgi:cell division control protein 6